jgi:hypothetical protein
MQRRLPVEQHDIVVLDVSLHNVASLEVLGHMLAPAIEAQVGLERTVVGDDISASKFLSTSPSTKRRDMRRQAINEESNKQQAY